MSESPHGNDRAFTIEELLLINTGLRDEVASLKRELGAATKKMTEIVNDNVELEEELQVAFNGQTMAVNRAHTWEQRCMTAEAQIKPRGPRKYTLGAKLFIIALPVGVLVCTALAVWYLGAAWQ